MSQQINLFNPIFLKKKKYFSAVTMVQALGMILLGTGIIGTYAWYQSSNLKKEAASTAAQLTKMKGRVGTDSGDGVKKKSASLESEVQKAETELKSLRKALAILERGNFGNGEGYAEYMRAFSRQTMNGVWLTGFSIKGAGSDISLQGRASKADLIPAYITRLKNEPVLQGKSFAMLEIQAPEAAKPAPGATRVAAQPAPASSGYIEFRLQSSMPVDEPQKEAPLSLVDLVTKK